MFGRFLNFLSATSPAPTPGPKSTNRLSSQGLARFSQPDSNTTTGSARSRKVALTIVGPAPPVPCNACTHGRAQTRTHTKCKEVLCQSGNKT
eukprot:3580153-Amphidinium_carterae.1